MPNPGMRQARDTDQDGNITGGRRTVAPPTQSAFGPASASDPAPAAPPATGNMGVGTGTTADPAADPSVFSVAKTLKNRGKTIDKAVDDAS